MTTNPTPKSKLVERIALEVRGNVKLLVSSLYPDDHEALLNTACESVANAAMTVITDHKTDLHDKLRRVRDEFENAAKTAHYHNAAWCSPDFDTCKLCESKREALATINDILEGK